MQRGAWLLIACLGVACATSTQPVPGGNSASDFRVEEATIADIHRAIESKQVTTVQVVRLYLDRIKAYNGPCVNQPDGLLGKVSTIPNAGQVNALITLNLRPATRKAFGFDNRKARSMTDAADDDPAMPDALEVAAELDRKFAETGKLVGPLHGVVMAFKDQYNTFDMRTTAGADAFYANDRPPRDATVVQRLRNAGAIILAKANLGEYANGDRSSFGGTTCNPYDTQRSPGGSSGGSGVSVSTNLVTCAIGQEGTFSIRQPAKNNNTVGLSLTQGLVSRDGMIGNGLGARVGPICRTVVDAARVLDVISGYDPADELTAFSIGRKPGESYQSIASGSTKLEGLRIGVLRDHMVKGMFTEADSESIQIVERALDDLRGLGATVVDPGPGKSLFQGCIDKYAPHARNALFIRQFPQLFPSDSTGNPAADHIPTLAKMFASPSSIQGGPTILNFGPGGAVGEGKYWNTRYLQERGDANIRTVEDLISKSNFHADVRPGGDGGETRFPDSKRSLENNAKAMTLDMRDRLANRFAIQQIVLQCMALQSLDALTYPTGNVPPPIMVNPTTTGGGEGWSLLGQQGFPAMTVPAGFTAQVFDFVRDDSAPTKTRLVGPVPAKLPVGIDFVGRPFDEATLFRIAAAYQKATNHRVPPPAFGPVSNETR
jgi:Asp-tRNA(Asn)/Glu-tRNA(Gln) amidotransferase A subunit family amidase